MVMNRDTKALHLYYCRMVRGCVAAALFVALVGAAQAARQLKQGPGGPGGPDGPGGPGGPGGNQPWYNQVRKLSAPDALKFN